jgi:hypothetical protein
MVSFVDDKLCSKTKTLSKQIDQNLMEEETLGVIYLEKRRRLPYEPIALAVIQPGNWVIITRLPNLNFPNKLTN